MINFDENTQHGIYVFSSGRNWKSAFHGAELYLSKYSTLSQTAQNLVILGPHINKQTEDYLNRISSKNNPIRVHKQIIHWQGWIKEAAAYIHNRSNIDYQEFHILEKREFISSILEILEKRDMLDSVKGIWREEKVFLDIVNTIDELRLAGFSNMASLEALYDFLEKQQEKFESVALKDLWMILQSWQQMQQTDLEFKKDFSGTLQFLIGNAQKLDSVESIYCLGFSKLSILEIEYLKELAKTITIYLPLDAHEQEIEDVLLGKDLIDLMQRHSLESLSQMISGATNTVRFIKNSLNANYNRFQSIYQEKILVAANPDEEINSVISFLNTLFLEKKIDMAQIVVPEGYLRSTTIENNFRFSSLVKSISGFNKQATSQSQVYNQFCQTVGMVFDNYPVLKCIEYAQLLSILKNKKYFEEATQFVKEKGFNHGLEEWTSYAEFYRELKKCEDVFPKTANGAEYEKSINRFFEITGYANLARSAESSLESNVQEDLANMLQASQILAKNTQRIFTLKEWLDELSIALDTCEKDATIYEDASIQLYPYQNWIPPLEHGGRNIRIVVAMHANSDPSISQNFLLTERDRILLKNWGLSCQLFKENDFIHWFQAIHDIESKIIYSRSKMDDLGKDIAPSILSTIYPLKDELWPKPILLNNSHSSLSQRSSEFKIHFRKPNHYSASFLDRWQECGFLALTERVWNCEESFEFAKLDPNPLDEGNIIHEVLEIFFTQAQENSFEFKDWQNNLSQIFERILSIYSLQNFNRGDFLLEIAKNRIFKKIKKFIESEILYFQNTPRIKKIICEHNFSLSLSESHKIIGKIDRVDIDPAAKRFLVVDYKSGSIIPTTKEVLSQQKLQLPLYVNSLLDYGEPVGAYYLSITNYSRNQGFVRKKFNHTTKNKEDFYFKYSGQASSLLEEDDFFSLIKNTKKKSFELIQQIEDGIFSVRPSDPEMCERCKIRPACRIREQLEVEKIIDEPNSREAHFKIFNQANTNKLSNIDKLEQMKISFSEEQEQALRNNHKMTFLEASAGSGKTTILVEKFMRVLQSFAKNNTISMEEASGAILAVSFTEKSASEIKNRLLERLTMEYNSNLALQAVKGISTIHGFNKRVIAQYAHLVPINPYFDVLSANDAVRIQSKVMYDFFTLAGDEIKGDLLELLNSYTRKDIEKILLDLLEKRSLLEYDFENASFIIDPDNIRRWHNIKNLFKLFCFKYDEAKGSSLDFNDLERISRILLKNDSVKKFFQKKYKYVMVDEFQDTNSVQREIIDAIIPANRNNLFVVGDAKQSIYRFRAADVAVFQNLRLLAENERSLFLLNQNYRSQKKIVDFSNTLTQEIFPKNWSKEKPYEAQSSLVESTKDSLEPVACLKYKIATENSLSRLSDKAIEAKIVAKLIQKLHLDGVPYSSIALIFKKLSGNDVFLKTLQEHNISYTLSNRGDFYKGQIVLDGISLLRAILDDRNRIAILAFLRSPWCNLDSFSVSNLMEMNREAIANFIEIEVSLEWFRACKKQLHILKLSDILQIAYYYYPSYHEYKNRLQIEKFIAVVKNFEEEKISKWDLVSNLSMIAGWSEEQNAMTEPMMPEISESGAVQILTAHAAKGLQFPVVILCDLDSKSKVDSPLVRFEPSFGISLKYRDEFNNFISTDYYKQMLEEQAKRDSAESRRLLYVAATRAINQLFIIMQDKEVKGESKSKTWADWIRGINFSASMDTFSVEEYFCKFPKQDLVLEKKAVQQNQQGQSNSSILKTVSIGKKIQKFSITEISAYNFCPEFYRLKYIQGWQDSVLSFYNETTKAKAIKKIETESNFMDLKISKLERGIAIHSLLENIQPIIHSTKDWEYFLRKKYKKLGFQGRGSDLDSLIVEDISCIERFIHSELGERLFFNYKNFYPELNFNLCFPNISLIGTIDRVIECDDGTWIVADYKTGTIFSENIRYTVQVEAYLLAMDKYCRTNNIYVRKFEGWIVDIFSGNNLKVELPSNANWYEDKMSRLLAKDFHAKGTEACIKCAYLSHCSIGQQYMLSYS